MKRLMLLCVLVAGCADGMPRRLSLPADRDAFTAAVFEKSPQEVVAALGEPTQKYSSAVWVYTGVVRAPSGYTYAKTVLRFDAGKVSRIEYCSGIGRELATTVRDHGRLVTLDASP